MPQKIEDLPFSPHIVDPLFSLQLAHSVSDVAVALGLEPAKFFFVVSNAQNGSYYRTFKIPKKKGGFRLISAPKRGLGLAQRNLGSLLLKKYNPKPYVKGYVRGESFLTNAKYHEGQKWVLNLDLLDFYPSITFPRVRGLFLSNYFGFNERVSTILARITTTDDGLPQGARTSPIIANLIAQNLDKKLISIATEGKLRYTRYADDITFSSNIKSVPSRLVRSWEPRMGDRVIQLGHELTEAIKTAGFSVNPAKTRLSFRYERQEVTGLTVNEKANVARKDISRLRLMIHSVHRHGETKAAQIWVNPSASPQDLTNKINGWLSFVRQVRGDNDPVLAKLCQLAVKAKITDLDWISRSAEMVREYDVFLSHASEDKEKVIK